MGDPTRANMLALLLDGQAHQASELGSVARVRLLVDFLAAQIGRIPGIEAPRARR